MKIATKENLGGGAADDAHDANTSTLETSGRIPLSALEAHYPAHVTGALILARLTFRGEPIPEAPHYTSSPDTCLADAKEAERRGEIPKRTVFTGVPELCIAKGCGAKCVSSAVLGGGVKGGEIPRTSCMGNLDYNAAVLAHDNEMAAYNRRHPELSHDVGTDLMSPAAGRQETEAALAFELGLDPGLVHELDELG